MHPDPEQAKHAADAIAGIAAWTAIFELVTGFFAAIAAISSCIWYGWRFYEYRKEIKQAATDVTRDGED